MTAAEVAEEFRRVETGARVLAEKLEGENDWSWQMFYEGFMILAERCVVGAGMAEKTGKEASSGDDG